MHNYIYICLYVYIYVYIYMYIYVLHALLLLCFMTPKSIDVWLFSRYSDALLFLCCVFHVCVTLCCILLQCVIGILICLLSLFAVCVWQYVAFAVCAMLHNAALLSHSAVQHHTQLIILVPLLRSGASLCVPCACCSVLQVLQYAITTPSCLLSSPSSFCNKLVCHTFSCCTCHWSHHAPLAHIPSYFTNHPHQTQPFAGEDGE